MAPTVGRKRLPRRSGRRRELGGHEDLVKRADLDSVAAVQRADMYRAPWIQSVGIVAVVAGLRSLPV